MIRSGSLHFFLILSQLWISYSTAPASPYPVKHIIVLMLENRSFDHFLGFLKRDNPEIDGLNGNETQLYNTSNPNSGKIQVNENGFNRAPDDPWHSFDNVTQQIYGYAKPMNATAVPKMNGFAQDEIAYGHQPNNTMSMFNRTTLPVLSTLALEYAVFDKWFSSVPGPTGPNRQYVFSGTSNGMTSDINTIYPQETYFEQLGKEGKSWRIYYSKVYWMAHRFVGLQNITAPNIVSIDSMLGDIAKGNLPDYTFIEPLKHTYKNKKNETFHSNWQHPRDSVCEGEKLIQEIYEALRKSPIWNTSMLILTYDEHGGFYDHVPPPQGVPRPDNVTAQNGFTFDRLGVRVPTVVISPWVSKGVVVHEPQGASAPTNTSQYDSTSILATTSKILGIKPTQNPRVAWAGTFDFLILNKTAPRTDSPTLNFYCPPPTPEEIERVRQSPLTDIDKSSIESWCYVNKRGPDCGKEVKKSGDVYEFEEREFAYYRARLSESKDGIEIKEL